MSQFYFLENFGLVFDRIFLSDLTNNAAWITDSQRVVRDVTGDDRAGADDATIPDGNATDDRHVTAEPAVVANLDGLVVFDIEQRAVCVGLEVSFLVTQGMHGGYQRDVGAKPDAVANRHIATVQHGKVGVGVEVLAQMGITPVVKENRSLQVGALTVIRNQLFEDLLTLFALVVKGHVVFLR